MIIAAGIIVAVALLAFLEGLANGQNNARCRSTPIAGTMDALLIDYDTKETRFSEIHFNIIALAMYERVYDRKGIGRPTLYEEWYSFRTGILTNRTFGGECHSYSVRRTLQQFGVGLDAKFEGTKLFGDSLVVDSFSGKFKENGSYYLYWAPVPQSFDNCIPVMNTYILEGPRVPYEERSNQYIVYTNFTGYTAYPYPCVPANTTTTRGNS